MKKLIGLDAGQVPTNGDLGSIAYQDADNLGPIVVNATHGAGVPPVHIKNLGNAGDGESLLYSGGNSDYIRIDDRGGPIFNIADANGSNFYGGVHLNSFRRDSTSALRIGGNNVIANGSSGSTEATIEFQAYSYADSTYTDRDTYTAFQGATGSQTLTSPNADARAMMFRVNNTNATTQFYGGELRNFQQPAFMMYGNNSSFYTFPNGWQVLSGGSGAGTTGASNGSIDKWGINAFEVYDQGGHFNLADGTFTAPMAGKYMFYSRVYARKNSTSNTAYMHSNFAKNGVRDTRTYTIGGYYENNANTWETVFVNQTVFDLQEGDYVQLMIYQTTDAVWQIFHDYCTFGGHMLVA